MLEDQIPVDDLRQLYVQGNLRQRYAVAASRIDNPDDGPNQVVAAVAALEGFARAIAVKALRNNGTSLEAAYEKVRWAKPIDLVEKHALPALGTTANDAFGAEHWELLPAAIDFRNLLVHEATYLHGGMCQKLVDATVHVFDRLAELSGAK